MNAASGALRGHARQHGLKLSGFALAHTHSYRREQNAQSGRRKVL
jgi:hypothetical protein